MKELIAAAAAIAVLSGGVVYAASGSSPTTTAQAASNQPKAHAGYGKDLPARSHLTGKSVDELLGQLGVTPDQLRAELKQKNPTAAKLTGKSKDEIKALVKPGVKRADLLKQFGVTEEQLRQARKGNK